MFIIGCDFHTCFRQIAMVDSLTSKIIERRLDRETGVEPPARNSRSILSAGTPTRTDKCP